MLLLLNATHPFYSSQFKVRRSLSVQIRIWVDVNERKYKCKKKQLVRSACEQKV